MPTSSTSKLRPAAGPSSYTRRYRPKSCKYDTYRLRSRTSQVDESLFGEPLKNKLMSRSRSMEAISNAGNEDEDELIQPTLFTRRKLPPAGARSKILRMTPTERPKTALATMRVAKEPEFEREERRVVKDTTPRPLVLSRREFDRIKQLAKVSKVVVI